MKTMTGTLLPGNWGPGVQAFTLHYPGWTWQPLPTVQEFATAEAAERWLRGEMSDMARYAYRAEFVWYGYDPTVSNDDGFVFGTDGYPDAVTDEFDLDTALDTDTIPWEGT